MTTTTVFDITAARNSILRALKRRSRTPNRWSVRLQRNGSNPTLLITVVPRYLDTGGRLHPEDAAELGRLLGLGGPAPAEGVRVPATEAALRACYAQALGMVREA